AIIMRFLLAAHGDRAFLVTVPESRLLDDASSTLQHIRLSVELEVDGLSEKAKRIDVFEFGARSEFLCALEPNRNVRIAKQTSLFHVAVIHFKVFEDLLQPGQIVVGFLRTADIRSGDNLDQGNAAAVVVEIGVASGVGKSLVQKIGR